MQRDSLGKADGGHSGGEGVAVTEKDEKQTNTQGNIRGKQILIVLGLESKRA